MNLIKQLFILILIVFSASCDSVEDTFTDIVIDPDAKITEEDALEENYNLRTPVYNISVAIDEAVNLSADEILNKIDEDAMEFLDCQFFEGSDLGFDDFMIENGDVVPPLSELRIFVVRQNFECDAIDKDVCSGIHFRGSDLIVIAEMGFGRCGNLPVLKHEIAHRYGLEGDHSNQDVFEQCSDPENCGLLDFLDDFNIFG